MKAQGSQPLGFFLFNGMSELRLATFRYGTPRPEGEGLRLGTTRFLPRGVPKADYARLDQFDVWLPTLAPSRDLLSAYRDGLPFETFARRYAREMSETDRRQVIRTLAELAKRTPIAVGCFCADETRCHRTVLARLLRDAAAGPS